MTQGDVRFEPVNALVSGNQGLESLQEIIRAAPNYLVNRGWLLLEHGYKQGDAVTELMVDAGYIDISTHKDLSGNDRMTQGCYMGWDNRA